MVQNNKHHKQIERKGETRMKEIAQMINEGGLGAEKYYDIKKDRSTEKKANT